MSLLSRWFGTAESSSTPSLQAIDVHAASRLQAAGALLVDVREPSEWRQGHAPDATLMPLGSLANRQADIPRDREVLLVWNAADEVPSTSEAPNLAEAHD